MEYTGCSLCPNALPCCGPWANALLLFKPQSIPPTRSSDWLPLQRSLCLLARVSLTRHPLHPGNQRRELKAQRTLRCPCPYCCLSACLGLQL